MPQAEQLGPSQAQPQEQPADCVSAWPVLGCRFEEPLLLGLEERIWGLQRYWIGVKRHSRIAVQDLSLPDKVAEKARYRGETALPSRAILAIVQVGRDIPTGYLVDRFVADQRREYREIVRVRVHGV